MTNVCKRVCIKLLRGIVKFFPFRHTWEREYYRYRLNHIASPGRKQMFERDFREKYESSKDLQERDYRKLWRDFWWGWIFMGVEPEDYFHFELFKKDWKWQNHHVTRDRLNFFKSQVNHPAQIPLLDDKEKFNHIWGDYLGRKWCIPHQVTKEYFVETFHACKKLIVKEVSGSGGHGIFMVDIADNLEEIYERIVAQDKAVIAEEYVFQKGFFHDINPSSLNSLRVTTIRVAEKAEVLFGGFRCGSTDTCVDNLHAGGFYFPIRLDSGEIEVGNNYTTRNVSVHPVSGLQIAGTLVPDWEQIKHYCCEAHTLAPMGLPFIGWDVCWSEGNLCMIEGNASPGFQSLTDPNEDMWKVVKGILSQMEKQKRLNFQNVE